MPLSIYSSDYTVHPLENIKFIIAVAAGKGGVGKSAVTVNLALVLRLKGYRVGILDIDLYGPSIRKMIGEEHLPTQREERFVPALSGGIKIMSMSYFRRDHESTAVRAPVANKLIMQFIKQVDWGHLDFLFIDFPPGTGDIQLTAIQQIPITGAIMVTTPQEVALLDVRKAFHLFEQFQVPIIGIVENMSYYMCKKTNAPLYLFGQGGGKRLAEETGTPFLASIPIDSDLCHCLDQGSSLFALDPENKKPATQALHQLAEQLIFHINLLVEEKGDLLREFELIWKEMS